MRHTVWLVVALVVAPAAACRAVAANADVMSPDRQRQVLRAALHAFDEAVNIAQEQPARAAELYRGAAAGFAALTDAGIRNAALEYNLGNCHFRLGQLGHAILHYRRAQRLDPTSEKLLANLHYARRQVEPYVEPSGQDRLLRNLLFIHYRTSARLRFWAAALLSAAGWLLLILRLRWSARPLLIIGGLAVLFSLSFGASVVWQTTEEVRRPSAVLVGDQAILRLGRGEGYDPALKQPLGPGVELRILQRRGDWVEVQLFNEQTGWLPADAVQPV